MEKERLNYQAPTITRRKVVMQEMIAASYDPGKTLQSFTVNSGSTTMEFNEGLNYAFENGADNYTNNFETNWEEE